MYKTIVIASIAFLLILTGTLSAQIKSPNVAKQMEIQHVQLKDTLVKMQLEKFIAAQLVDNPAFKDQGYVVVVLKTAADQSVRTSLFVNTGFSNFDSLDKDSLFPIYYTEILKKIVVFKYDVLTDLFELRFSTESKHDFQKLIEPFLFPKEKMMFPGKDGGTKHTFIRKGELHNLDGGIQITVMKNGTVRYEQASYH